MTALFNQPQKSTMFSPDVDYNTETVEGRIGGLLGTDSAGNYANPVVRQAQDRQEQAFHSRGLRNSSMAVQGGTEAAISKAIEIASPDARTTYDNRRSNLDQMHASRSNYQQAAQTIATNFQRQVDTINASNMTPDDKSVAIAQLQAMRDGEMVFQNSLFSRVPGWQQEWLAPAVPDYNGQGVDVSRVTNTDMLANIAQDPASSAEYRARAQERLYQLQTAGGGTRADGSTMIGGASASQQEAAEYAAYRATGGPLPFEQWMEQRRAQAAAQAAMPWSGPLN